MKKQLAYCGLAITMCVGIASIKGWNPISLVSVSGQTQNENENIKVTTLEKKSNGSYVRELLLQGTEAVSTPSPAFSETAAEMAPSANTTITTLVSVESLDGSYTFTGVADNGKKAKVTIRFDSGLFDWSEELELYGREFEHNSKINVGVGSNKSYEEYRQNYIASDMCNYNKMCEHELVVKDYTYRYFGYEESNLTGTGRANIYNRIYIAVAEDMYIYLDIEGDIGLRDKSIAAFQRFISRGFVITGVETDETEAHLVQVPKQLDDYKAEVIIDENQNIRYYVNPDGTCVAHLCEAGGEVNIPAEIESHRIVEVYGYDHLWENGVITSAILPEGLLKVGEGAFHESDIESIVLPDGVIEIGAFAFSDCEKLTSVFLPESVTTIGEYAFKGCALTSIIIPESVEYIGECAFANWLGETALIQVFVKAGSYAEQYFMENMPETVEILYY